MPFLSETETRLRLVGTWHLSEWEIRYRDGRPSTFPFGTEATGMILGTHDGFMSACIAMDDRAALDSTSVRSAPTAQQVATFGSYFQYAGRFNLDSQHRWYSEPWFAEADKPLSEDHGYIILNSAVDRLNIAQIVDIVSYLLFYCRI